MRKSSFKDFSSKYVLALTFDNRGPMNLLRYTQCKYCRSSLNIAERNVPVNAIVGRDVDEFIQALIWFRVDAPDWGRGFSIFCSLVISARSPSPSIPVRVAHKPIKFILVVMS